MSSSPFPRRRVAGGNRPHLIATSASPKKEWAPRLPTPATASCAAPKQKWIPRGPKSPPVSTIKSAEVPHVVLPDAPQTVQEIQDKIARRAVKCMVCFDMVGRSGPIWSCSSCCSIFHLHCIRKWARSPASIASGDWLCPGCQTPQSTPARDLNYYCFCGRLHDPPYDLDFTPHSCGEPCGKPLGCPHPCPLQCHPGRCPPCSALVSRRKCPCGRTNVDKYCSDRFPPLLTCGHSCKRLLPCGRHTCERTCHTGPCGPCKKLLLISCFCGVKAKAVLCSNIAVTSDFDAERGVFSCNSFCRRILQCGNHLCWETCHPGLCGECKFLPGKIRTCHCGKKKLVEERKSCLDPIPTCFKVCGKPMACKAHFCRIHCHEGDCPPCSIHVQQRCRCGWRLRVVECRHQFDEKFIFICEKTCGQKKNCSRHRCTERCCPLSNSYQKQLSGGEQDPHLCSLPCRKQLTCESHTCPLACHSGSCPPCLETVLSELTCACGKTSISPPVPCGAVPPPCPHPCLVPQLCGHAASHFCHFGNCPPCPFSVMKECGSDDVRCNQMCGKTSQCGIHECDKICHPSPYESSSPSSESGARSSCGRLIGAPGMDSSHNCNAPFHPMSPCPEQNHELTLESCSGSFKIDVLLESSAIQKQQILLQLVNGSRWKVLLHSRKNLAMPEVFSGHLWREPNWFLPAEESFKFLSMGKSKAGTGSCREAHAFCHIIEKKRDDVNQIGEMRQLSIQAAKPPAQILRLKSVAQAIASQLPAYHHLIDMDARLVVSMLGMLRDSDISTLVLRFCGDHEPGDEASKNIWRRNNGNAITANAVQLNLLDEEGSSGEKGGSTVKSGDDMEIEAAGEGGEEMGGWEESYGRG